MSNTRDWLPATRNGQLTMAKNGTVVEAQNTAAMKKVLFVLCLVFQMEWAFAEDKKEWSFMPLFNYEFVSVEGQKYHVPGGGLIFLKGDRTPPLTEDPNNVLIALFYNRAIINNPPFNYANLMHNIIFTVERNIKRHFIQAVFTSNSDQPVYGGLQTTYSSIGYGYELLRREHIHLTLGAAAYIGDFGIDLPNGGTFPLFPLPIIRFDYSSRYVNFAFDFPELKMTLFPENKVLITSTARLDFYKYKDEHDMLFDCILWYRFFTKEFTATAGDFTVGGDIAGVGLGIKNGGIDFILGEKGKLYDINYYSIFGVIDISLLRINGGYIFYSRELYEKDKTKYTGTGFFVNVSVGI